MFNKRDTALVKEGGVNLLDVWVSILETRTSVRRLVWMKWSGVDAFHINEKLSRLGEGFCKLFFSSKHEPVVGISRRENLRSSSEK